MAKQERLYSATEAAYATRITVNTLRTKVSRLGIKGTRKGVQIFYTKAQLQDIFDNKPSKTMKALPAKKAKAKKSVERRIERKVRAKK
jgi:hypothetical protein